MDRSHLLMCSTMAGTAVEEAKVAISWFKRNEIPRKVLHGSIALLTIILYTHGVQLSQVTPVLLYMLVPIASLELLRFFVPPFNRAYIAVVGPLMREKEKHNQSVNGVIWYLVGLITVFTLFSKDVCFVAICLLSWSDLAASTVGRAYGHLSPKVVGSKSLIGSVAAFVTGLLSTLMIYKFLLPQWTQYNPPSMIMYNENLSSMSVSTLGVVMGFAAALTEMFPVIDDNLSIPIGCACIEWIAVKITTKPYSYGVLA